MRILAGSITSIIYIAHNTYNALFLLVKTEQDSLRKLLKLSEPHAGSLSLSGSEFQTVGPAIEKCPTAICVETTARYNETVSRGLHFVEQI